MAASIDRSSTGGAASAAAPIPNQPQQGADCRIEPARPSDVPAMAALLHAAGLPHADFADHVAHFLVLRDVNGSVAGAIGAEVSGPDALLRSLLVAPTHRGRGWGEALLRNLEVAAASWGVEQWWLLTTTAENFFARHGFAVVARETAPEGIRRTNQFQGGCARSATCLSRVRKAAP
jgi:amino-acid N-acetyltransferase